MNLLSHDPVAPSPFDHLTDEKAGQLLKAMAAGGHIGYLPSHDPGAPSTHVRACPRHPVAKLARGLIPQHYIEALEQNQLLSLCCRHAEEHDIEAFKSHPNEAAPDIYVLHCNGCGRRHIRFCVGGGDVRPVWEVR